MRIVCPGCEAAYEVPEAMLSPGRTVRCARCGRGWIPLPEQGRAVSPAVSYTHLTLPTIYSV